ncbi:uncharacterized protein LOC111364580 [Spodoptera litura]|uniref:Uncharacterized protein LOC111364580 n=1 Tax=Spodoptera litura TaxID=69820 RepID=A0A9J7EVY7_SPOLT|nr:uncharacterized protein LOC111364580 [Spodoptera litura]
MVTVTFKVLINVLIAVNIPHCYSCPIEDTQMEMKAAYKSGEIHDQEPPITLEKIKTKLKESEIFNWEDPALTEREKKEMNKLFDAVEIMTTSRNRQPSSVQNMFSSLRLVERVVKKQLKEGQISEELANKFNWEKLTTRQRRENRPMFYLDKTTNMRMFNLH